MRLEDVVIALFAVATAVALVARRFRVPYTVALVITGLVLGSASVTGALRSSWNGFVGPPAA